MSDEDIKYFGFDVEKLERRVNNLNPTEDINRVKREIDELEAMHKKLSDKIEDLESDVNDQSGGGKAPLLRKIDGFKENLDNIKDDLNKKKEQWKTANNIELLKEGKLTGADKIEAERNMIMGQHNEVNYQGDIIKGIKSNVKESNENMKGVVTELKDQGDQMGRIQEHNDNAEKIVKDTNQIMSKMERRQLCMKVIGVIAAILMGIVDIALLIWKIS